MKQILFDQRCERSKAASFRSDRVCLSSFYLVKGIIGRVAFLPFIVRSDRKTIAVVTDDNTNAAFPLLKHHETNTADQPNPVQTLKSSPSFRSDRVCLSSFYLVKGIIGRGYLSTI